MANEAPDDLCVTRAVQTEGPVLHGLRKRCDVAMDKLLGRLPDEELMVLAGGDEKAFEELYKRHNKRLLIYISIFYQLWRGTITAQDLSQDVWVRLLRARERYVPKAKLSTFLYTIARRAVIDDWRSKKVEAGHVRGVGTSPEGGDEAELEPMEEPCIDMSIDLGKELDQLPVEQREAFILFAVVEMTMPEIAEIQQVNKETVKSRIRLARDKLRNAESLRIYFER
jgi:RNA polymerase sigma-70 factor, ECF subfamily